MEKSQREYYLNEKVKAIQKELGDSEEGAEFDELQDKINNTDMSSDAKDKCLSELKKLKMMSPMSAEASVVRTFILSVTRHISVIDFVLQLIEFCTFFRIT